MSSPSEQTKKPQTPKLPPPFKDVHRNMKTQGIRALSAKIYLKKKKTLMYITSIFNGTFISLKVLND